MRFLVLAWLLLGNGVAFADRNDTQDPARAEKPEYTVLVLGDSLSAAHNIAPEASWVSLLEVELKARLPGSRVVNASISGETSAGGAERIDALLAEHRPQMLLLELGANDSLRGLALSQTRGHLQRIADAARAADCKLLLIGIELPVNYGRRYREGLRKLYAELAQQSAAGLIPHLLAPLGTGLEQFQEDGIHPTAAAQPALMELVWKALVPLLPKPAVT